MHEVEMAVWHIFVSFAHFFRALYHISGEPFAVNLKSLEGVIIFRYWMQGRMQGRMQGNWYLRTTFTQMYTKLWWKYGIDHGITIFSLCMLCGKNPLVGASNWRVKATRHLRHVHRSSLVDWQSASPSELYCSALIYLYLRCVRVCVCVCVCARARALTSVEGRLRFLAALYFSICVQKIILLSS